MCTFLAVRLTQRGKGGLQISVRGRRSRRVYYGREERNESERKRILEAAGKRAKEKDPKPERPEPQKQKLPDRMRESAKRALTKGRKLTKIIDPIAHLSDVFYRAPVGFSLKIHRSQRVVKFLDKVIQEFSWINPKSIQESESHPPPGTNACEIKIRCNFCMFIMLGHRAKFARLDNEAKAHPTSLQPETLSR